MKKNIMIIVVVLTMMIYASITSKAQTTKYDSLCIEWGMVANLEMVGCSNGICYSPIINCDRRAMKKIIDKEGEPLSQYLCGYVDTYDSIVIPLIYNEVKSFQPDGIGIVTQLNPSNNPSYYSWHINKDGTPLYTPYKKYCDVQPYHNGYAIVDVDGGYHLCHINKSGKRIYTQTYLGAHDFDDKGHAVMVKSINLTKNVALYVVINTNGQELLSVWGQYSDYSSNGEKKQLFPQVIETYMNK